MTASLDPTAPASDGTSANVDVLVGGMTCGACARRVERTLNKLDGVTATVNYATEKASVAHTDAVTVEQLLSHRSGIGYYLDEDAQQSITDYVMPVPVHRLDSTEAYLALGTAQATAISIGLEEWGFRSRWRARLGALLLAYLPVVGSATAVWGAGVGWHWSIGTAVMRFFGPLAAIVAPPLWFFVYADLRQAGILT